LNKKLMIEYEYTSIHTEMTRMCKVQGQGQYRSVL
jgi:hypothetical protein